MTVALKKWGNSLALRLPKDITQTLHIENNSLLELDVHEGILTIKPKKEQYLESLVSKINSKNLHKEIDTANKVGNEEW
ncbi:Programmed cell death antitoxin MazE [hydrothermal vent metagenome]|uniref:Programmed cell death antitoxin MazE n=1 Tax=hydrothermal vent metagenome TaxID=652676 RepID=A0A1W1CAJ9_9ZZZZ